METCLTTRPTGRWSEIIAICSQDDFLLTFGLFHSSFLRDIWLLKYRDSLLAGNSGSSNRIFRRRHSSRISSKVLLETSICGFGTRTEPWCLDETWITNYIWCKKSHVDQHVDVVRTDIVTDMRDLEFDFWAGQIGHSVVTAAMFLWSCVVYALSRGNGSPHSLHASV